MLNCPRLHNGLLNFSTWLDTVQMGKFYWYHWQHQEILQPAASQRIIPAMVLGAVVQKSAEYNINEINETEKQVSPSYS